MDLQLATWVNYSKIYNYLYTIVARLGNLASGQGGPKCCLVYIFLGFTIIGCQFSVLLHKTRFARRGISCYGIKSKAAWVIP